MDRLYKKISKEQSELEKQDRNIEAKVDCHWKDDSLDSSKKEQAIRPAQIFQTYEEQVAVERLLEEAKKRGEVITMIKPAQDKVKKELKATVSYL